MKKPVIVGAVVVVVLVLGILAVLFFKSSSSPIKIVSADGKFTLEIPPPTLSETDVLKEITVTRVSAEDSRGASGVAYKLSPEGLSFSKPVKFTTTMDIKPGEVPFGLHVDTRMGEITAIENYHAELDYARGSATITGTIDHFSYIFISEFGIGVLLAYPKSNLLVGRTREANASVTASKEDISSLVMLDENWNVRYKRKGGAMVGGEFGTPSNAITPGQIPDALPRAILPSGGTAQASGTFTCIENGPAVIFFYGDINATIETEVIGLSPIDATSDFLFGRQVEVSTHKTLFNVTGEKYNCVSASVDAVQETAPKDSSIKETTPEGETDVKICGGIFGPCEEKK